MILQPGLDAVGVEDVAARKEQALLAELEVGDADRAAGQLHVSILALLAVLFLYFDERQLFEHFLTGGSSVLGVLTSLLGHQVLNETI